MTILSTARSGAPVTPEPATSLRPAPFRPEIQALRAIAVLVVVIYHLWPHRLTGGFIGVDVFFVISGFLITQHLLKEVALTGRISLAQFWARRIRRLLPAALVVLVASVIGVLILVPQLYWQAFLSQVAASALYVQNWVLAYESVQYFATESHASPVQHFWSLSVEEQFYFVWPLLLVVALVLARKASPAVRKRTIVALLAIVAVASLAYSIHLTATSPGQAYFATPVRAWEFAAGGLLAAAAGASTMAGRTVLRLVVAWGGWAAIAYAALTFTSATAFPGYLALIPVLGTIAVIWAGSPESALSPNRILGSAPMRSLGDVSYSVYLWHWPLIIFSAMVFGEELQWPMKLVVLTALVPLAYGTMALVENPVRFSPMLTQRKPRFTFMAMTATAALIAGSTLGITAYVGNASEADAVRAANVVAEAVATSDSCFGAGAADSTGCADIEYPALTPNPSSVANDLPTVYEDACYSEISDAELLSCTSGTAGAPYRVALVGDSHAAHWFPAIDRLATERGWELSPYLKSACPQSMADKHDDVAAVADSCRDWNSALADELAASEPFDLVIVSHSATGDGKYGSDGQAVRGFRDAWKTVTDRGSSVAVIRDIPNAKDETTDCVARHQDDAAACELVAASALGTDDLMVEAAEGQPGVSVVDMTDYFCTDDACATVRGGVVVYRDSHHMTATYATTLAPFLGKKLEKVTAGQ
ncbi:MAG TPA: acyltransferase family protein [Glaciibacter sp.]|nr:acyltransferase family protein [Glaciibacter sp.]